MIRPAMWLLEKYDHPYYLVYTNDPGEIVYEDQYQIAAKTEGRIDIEDLQPSWTPETPDEGRRTENESEQEMILWYLE